MHGCMDTLINTCMAVIYWIIKSVSNVAAFQKRHSELLNLSVWYVRILKMYNILQRRSYALSLARHFRQGVLAERCPLSSCLRLKFVLFAIYLFVLKLMPVTHVQETYTSNLHVCGSDLQQLAARLFLCMFLAQSCKFLARNKTCAIWCSYTRKLASKIWCNFLVQVSCMSVTGISFDIGLY